MTNILSVSAPSSVLTINGGTISAVSGSNAFQVVIGNGTLSSGNSMAITNGGKLLSELLEIGSSSSYNTGIVAGVGSILSNYTAGVSYLNTNKILVGVGSNGNSTRNYLAVRDGASLINNGDLAIGDNASSTFNAAVFGGPGARL